MKSIRNSLWCLAASLGMLGGIVSDLRADLLYVGSVGENRIRAYNTTSGAFTSTFFDLAANSVTNPGGLAVSGNFLFVGSNNSVIRFDLTNGTKTTVISLSAGAVAADLAFEPVGGRLFVAVRGGATNPNTVQAFTGVTAVSGFPITTPNKVITLGTQGMGGGNPSPEGLGFYNNTSNPLDPNNGDLYIVSENSGAANRNLQKVTAANVAGPAATTATISLSRAGNPSRDLAFGPNRNPPAGPTNSENDLYLTVDTGAGVTVNNSVAVFDVGSSAATATFINTLASNPATTSLITNPWGIVFRTETPSPGNFYIANEGNNNVIRITPSGTTTVFSTGTQPVSPHYLVFGPNAVPEPATLALLGLTGGVLGLYAWRQKRKRKTTA